MRVASTTNYFWTAVLFSLDYHLRSIVGAGANAILLALKFVASSSKSKFMICSDYLSCLLAIESCKTQNPFSLKIDEIYKNPCCYLRTCHFHMEP